ncbi:MULTISPECIES: hypothetical protein [unclassified Streptomyces]|uniref:hypothetical protein n=1 Tax=unclassified Streptomyces TaxID=2593676 RepID=UPI00382CF373
MTATRNLLRMLSPAGIRRARGARPVEEDPVLGQVITRCVAEVVGHRLTSTRTRLLDLYGPYGSGPTR